ncbi:lipid A biosynthesis protein [Rhizobium sp. Leaf384]|uniref:lipid-A-disaccharide synthase N-terminal domain-containing protein n=1 Tax=unclassified Rhizobium TaxID=2613769 RepID=UPI00071255F4|nr:MULTISPECIES: lipid-A-disaccharide synthase N-terminal domain-containing protein [unclassified Rhizobium]KQS74107.1 lipid A biosynthesis protein [Rhizobium sp. Leaf383]KQS80302.1 lipid A biosynthesis protein [Rhizobium sp. Leaf384]
MHDILVFFGIESPTDLAWLIVGLFAQTMFSLRFIIQWLRSEKEKRSVIPHAFWWFSLFGGLTLLAYGLHRREPVLILGQVMGVVIYGRNIVLIHRSRGDHGGQTGPALGANP